MELLSPDCDELVCRFLFRAHLPPGDRWILLPARGDRWCPFQATVREGKPCIPSDPGQSCQRCSHMRSFVPRFATVLEALLLGFFQETTPVERVIREERSVKKDGNPKKRKRVVQEYRFRIIDASRKEVYLTPEERQELTGERHSWIAGREVLPIQAIDWANPPPDDAVVMAPVPVRKQGLRQKVSLPI